MKKIDKIDVWMEDRHVGTLAETNHCAAFQYSDEWIETGFSLNPFRLPLRRELYIPPYLPFEGVFGVFADSLPDGWGRLVVDRYIQNRFKRNAQEISNFYRLTMVSDAGMGALSYRPAYEFLKTEWGSNYDVVALECRKLLEERFTDNLDDLFRLGGSSGGARPKILTDIDGERWIIKFPSSQDDREIGRQEYEYSLCAKKCMIQMAETRLFPSKECSGYFGTKRFDREWKKGGEKKIHMASVSGLLETSHRTPNLDYNDLMRLTASLTQDIREMEKLFDLMCFNVFAHNRDDHSKNFSFLYHEEERRWKLSPAYDLTYSFSAFGQHATTVDGEGQDPGMTDIMEVAKKAGLNLKKSQNRAKEIEEIVKTSLKRYL